eukprot:CAMPEP_0114659338 /NCGR_PEP_ID=MMETSP0191-20121206/17643_1 /TAXON_ID=126664 /ORGANISM="Sorites sp." /LENGTH=270 /DNA_ID=CAMNT_0001884251 /DNA_START=114 /DNA_END=926 /DNA_ORIENTATION=+
MNEEKYSPDNTLTTNKNDNEMTNIDENDEDIEKLSKFTKLVAPIYITVAVLSLVFMIVSAATKKVWGGILVWLMTLIMSYFGCWGVYKWGTVEMQIEKLKANNNEYQSEIDTLKSTKNELKVQVDDIQAETDKLQQDVDQLDEQLKEFDELRNSLQDIASDSQDINDMINGINGMYDDMRSMMLETEKAKLFEAYYDVQFLDNDDGLSEREYKRLLNKLPIKSRNKFNQMGTFQELAGDDNTIDLQEFQQIVERFLKNIDDELVDKLNAK